jgi:hypothetical protein
MSDNPATVPGVHERRPVRISPRWGLSSLDWYAHAIDEDADHPYGVYVARCGHRLLTAATLYEDPPPPGRICLSCIGRSDRTVPL